MLRIVYPTLINRKSAGVYNLKPVKENFIHFKN